MSYLVLARKWRPRRFDEVIGQEVAVRALTHALNGNRVHHAYLFTGTRGVGKTTLARLLAKALNCEAGVSATPCLECETCRETEAGRAIDLIEVDAASRTKVEDTRELLDNVLYAPVRARYKVYLIDEVHMLSGHSFNALLKTLEEPPEHVKFLLATTDPKKLPITILSRCLQLHLRRLPAAALAKHLERIATEERIRCDAQALQLLSSAADGSVRDALSLFDQAIAHGGDAVELDQVRAMLGAVDDASIWPALDALTARDGRRLLEAAHALYAAGVDALAWLDALLGSLHRLAVMQAVPMQAEEADAALLEFAERLAPADVQLYYQIALNGRRDLAHVPDPHAGLEMILLRMLAFQPTGTATTETPEKAPAVPAARRTEPAGRGAGTQQSKPDAAPLAASRSVKHATIKAQDDTASAMVAAIGDEPAPALINPHDWTAAIAIADLRGVVRELAMHCSLESQDGDRWRLTIDPAHAQLHTAERMGRLAAALSRVYGRSIRLQIDATPDAPQTPARRQQAELTARQQDAEQLLRADPVVQALCTDFHAELLPDSVESLDPLEEFPNART